MTTQNEDRDFVRSEWFEPFPEPHTIPSGWDLSGLFPSPPTDSVTERDSSAESESRQHSPAANL